MKWMWVRTLLYTAAIGLSAGCSDAPPPSGQAPEPSAPAPAPGIEDARWELIRLGDQAVTASSPERMPYITLSPADQRAAGYGGCNRMFGSYSLSGDQLTFSQMASTKMACQDGMDTEQAFHDALGKVARWRLQGEQLELLDAAGESLAVLERKE